MLGRSGPLPEAASLLIGIEAKSVEILLLVGLLGVVKNLLVGGVEEGGVGALGGVLLELSLGLLQQHAVQLVHALRQLLRLDARVALQRVLDAVDLGAAFCGGGFFGLDFFKLPLLLVVLFLELVLHCETRILTLICSRVLVWKRDAIIEKSVPKISRSL